MAVEMTTVVTPGPDPALAAEQGKQAEQARLAAPAALAGLARFAALAALADALPVATARVRIPQSCLLCTSWPVRAG
jgi:hypothetical protein